MPAVHGATLHGAGTSQELEEAAPGRVCTEEKTQLGAEAPQGDVCAVRYVRSVYQHITDMSGGFFYGW